MNDIAFLKELLVKHQTFSLNLRLDEIIEKLQFEELTNKELQLILLNLAVIIKHNNK